MLTSMDEHASADDPAAAVDDAFDDVIEPAPDWIEAAAAAAERPYPEPVDVDAVPVEPWMVAAADQRDAARAGLPTPAEMAEIMQAIEDERSS